jgi:pimeloyl-ACP methyl ester carboxylesterase
LGIGAILAVAFVALAIFLMRPISTPPFRDRDGHALRHSIASIETWRINGIDESVIIRGRDTSSPILIWVHGGPGSSETPVVRHFNAVLENHFVMVYWDQRYAGRSLDPFAPKPKKQTVGDYVADLDVLISGLRRRLRSGRVVIVAHSWGTVPGILYAERHPENVAAYVGIGQEADTPESERRSYAWLLHQARSYGDTDAESRLTRLGPPSAASGNMWTPRDLLARYGGAFHGNLSVMKLVLIGVTAKEANWRDGAAVLLAKGYNRVIEDAEAKVILDRNNLKFEVPIVFMSGRYDRTVDADLARRYLERLSAPKKAFVWFDRSAHYPPFEEPDRFNEIMTSEILPLALANGAGRFRSSQNAPDSPSTPHRRRT